MKHRPIEEIIVQKTLHNGCFCSYSETQYSPENCRQEVGWEKLTLYPGTAGPNLVIGGDAEWVKLASKYGGEFRTYKILRREDCPPCLAFFYPKNCSDQITEEIVRRVRAGGGIIRFSDNEDNVKDEDNMKDDKPMADKTAGDIPVVETLITLAAVVYAEKDLLMELYARHKKVFIAALTALISFKKPIRDLIINYLDKK